jgi:AraC family transcriptional regulator
MGPDPPELLMAYEMNRESAGDSATLVRDFQAAAPLKTLRLGPLTARLVGTSGDPVPDLHADDVRVFVPATFARVSRGAAGELDVLRAPSVCVVPPGQRLQLRVEPGSDGVLLALDTLACEERAIRVHGRAARVCEPRMGDDGHLREAAEAIAREMRSGVGTAAAPGDGRVDAIALHLVSHYGTPEAASGSSGLTRPRLERVLALVDERLTDALPVSELAEAVHLSPFHFSRMFRVSTGRSPHEWIMLKRMARAKSLLACTRMPLPEVAKSSGYRTHSHFSGMFHAVVGMTPGQYRARHA